MHQLNPHAEMPFKSKVIGRWPEGENISLPVQVILKVNIQRKESKRLASKAQQVVLSADVSRFCEHCDLRRLMLQGEEQVDMSGSSCPELVPAKGSKGRCMCMCA